MTKTWAREDTHYTIDLGMIVSANPYAHVYGVMPLWKQLQAHPQMLGIPIGVLGNVGSGVQLQPSYTYGTRVLILFQDNFLQFGTTRLCFILGAAESDFFRGTSLKEWVDAPLGDEDNLSVRNFTGFELIQKALKISPVTPYATGHGSADMLPGDFDASGERSSLYVGDFMSGLRAKDTEIFVDGIYRRLVERTLFRTSTTINSYQDISLVGNSTLTTIATSGRPKFNKPTTDKKKTPATYRKITQFGDIVYGETTVLLSEDGKTPLAKDYLGYDGTRQIYTASRLRIGKTPGIEGVVYKGPRLNPAEPALKIDTKNPDQPLTPTKKDNWRICKDAMLFAENGYPESFLDAAESGYTDFDTATTIKDSITGNWKITKGSSHIDFLDDGSIKIVDAWGSYILLSRGNIEFHAMNNIMQVAARDLLGFAGANATSYAGNDLSIQAYKGSLYQQSGKDIRFLAGAKEPGEFVLETAGTLRFISQALKADADSMVFTIRTSDTTISGGRLFQVLAPEGQVNLSGAVVRINSDSLLALTAFDSAITIASGVTLVGNLSVRGGICCTNKNLSLSVIAPNGGLTTKTFLAGGFNAIVHTFGSVYAKMDVLAGGGVFAGSTVAGQTVYTIGPTDGELKQLNRSSRSRVLSAVRNPPTISVPTVNPSNSGLAKLIGPADLREFRFTFGKESQNCTFTVAHKLPVGRLSDIINTGYVDHRGVQQYIYPGRSFWEKTGLIDVAGKPHGFNTLPNAMPNNQK